MSIVTVADAILGPGDVPRSGVLTFVPTKQASTGRGIVAASSSVSVTLDNAGEFSIDLTPNEEFDATVYYQLYFAPTSGPREFLGLYDFPVSDADQDLISNKVTAVDTNVYYKFASQSVFEMVVGNAASGSVAQDALIDLDLTVTASDSTTRAANTTKITNWYNSLGAAGGVLKLPVASIYFNTIPAFEKPVILLGAGQRFNPAGDQIGTRLFVESGQSGLRFLAGAAGSCVRDLSIATRSGFAGQTAGDGVYHDVTIYVWNVHISGFARDGQYANGTSPANSDFSQFYGVHSYANGRDNFHANGGDDSNIILYAGCNSTNAGRHGVYDNGNTNLIDGIHISGSGLNPKVTATTGSITASGSPQSVTLNNVTGITVGMLLEIDDGSDVEWVTVTALPGSNQITTTFTKNHANGSPVKECAKDIFVNGSSSWFRWPYCESGPSCYLFIGADANNVWADLPSFGGPTIQFQSAGDEASNHKLNDAGVQNELRIGERNFPTSGGHVYKLFAGDYTVAHGLEWVDEADSDERLLSYYPALRRMVFNNIGHRGAMFATGTPQALSGPGAVNVTSAITHITTTGADAFTLADGVQGQEKEIYMIVDGGDGTLTPTNAGGFTTITFNDAGDSVTLRFTNSKWYVKAAHGVTIA